MSSAIPNLGAIDPIGLIIDVGAGVLGLPPEVKNIAKIAVGIAMANPVTALNGATGLLGNLEERAATEWKPPPEGSPYATAGYAPSPSMESSGGLPGGANAANVQGYKVQGYIVQGYKENDGPSTPPSDDPASTPPECSGGTSSTGGDPKGRLLSRSDSLYYGAVEILWSEFTKAETGGYWKIPDGNLTLVDLGTLAADPNTPAHLRNAAAYFVDNPQEWGRLCAERGTLWHPITGMPTMNMAGLAAEMREGHQLGAIGPGTGVGGSGGTGGVGGGSGGTGGVGGGSGGTGGSGGVGGSGAAGNDGLDKVMNDPTLSAHEKAELILEQILGSLDTEMLDLLNKMRRVRKEQAGLKEDDKEKGAELASDMEMLQYRLQKVMERRTQMFTLLTNMQRLQHEASMAAVQNTR